MAEIDPRLEEALLLNVNAEVIRLTPAVSLCSSLVALTGALSTNLLTSSNQFQLNSISAMIELSRQLGERRVQAGMLTDEAVALLKQALAATKGP